MRYIEALGLIPCLLCRLVGSSGLEPPTSRLSGARSNHLSYEPIQFSVYLCLLSPLVEMMGIEPMTPCLQGRCSPSWATPPYLRYFFLNGHSKLNNSESRTHKLSLVLTSSPFLVLLYFLTTTSLHSVHSVRFSIERRWSSRTFRYGYLVTT